MIKKRKTGTRTGKSKRLPGMKRVQTRSHNRIKALPKEAENPVIDDGEADFDRPPDVLNIDGVKIWRSTVKLLRAVGELNSTDYYGLKTMCYQYQRICKRERADQDIPVHERNCFNRLLCQFGMTPVSRNQLDKDGKLRKNGPPQPGFSKKKVFEEQDVPIEGEEKERASKVTRLEDRAANLL